MLPLWTLIPGWLLTTITVTGNGLVIYLITTKGHLRTTTNWFVLSLAVADFSFGALYFPRLSFCSINDPTCANQAVIIVYCIGYSFVFASVASLCALTLDRYIAIVKPLRYVTFMTKKRVALLIFAAWSVPVLVFISFILLLLATSGTTKEIMAQCMTLCLTFLCVFACIFHVFATVRIFAIARKLSRQTAAMVAQLSYNHRSHRARIANHDTAATKMVGTVVAVFVLCYLLDIYVNFCLYGGICPLHESLGLLNALALLMNSAVNPITYAFFKREIRRELKRLFRRRLPQSPPKSGSDTEQEHIKRLPCALRENRVYQCPDV